MVELHVVGCYFEYYVRDYEEVVQLFERTDISTDFQRDKCDCVEIEISSKRVRTATRGSAWKVRYLAKRARRYYYRQEQ